MFAAKKNRGALCRGALGYWVRYSLLFAAVMAVGYSALWLNGKTLMWRMDEAGQSYVAFAYMGQWLRQWARQILTGGGVMPPLFELSLGMGADVIQTLNYVGFGNPILALFSLLPSAWWAAAFTAAVLAQVYLAGLAFSWYAFEWKVSTGHALIGSLCYAFCGHALVYQTVFSPYLAPILYLPVMLLGFERAFRGKSAWPLVLATAYGGLCGYYTLFMCTAFLVPYGLARGWYIHRLKGWKRTIGCCLKGALAYLWGIFLSAPILLPAVLSALGSSRGESLGMSGKNLFLPDGEGLLYVLPNGFLPQNSWKWEALALPVLLVPVLGVLLAKRGRKYRFLQGALLFALLMAAFPKVRSFLNGMGADVTVEYRWNFLISFLLCFVLMVLLPDLIELNRREKLAMLGAAAVYSAYAYGAQNAENGRQILLLAGFAALCAACVLAMQAGVTRRVFSGALCGLVCLNTAWQLNWFYGSQGWDMAQNCLGYYEKGQQGAVIDFNLKEWDGQTPNQFRLEGVEVYALPMEPFAKQADALRANAMKDLQQGTNRFFGTMEMQQDGVLCLAVPYSKGWSARVDGQTVPVEQINLRYVGIPLQAGSHQVEFRYFTPGLKAGSFLCVGTALGMVAAWGLKARQKRRNS